MSQCAVKRGIITLRDCGSEATDTCAKCSRPICQEHTKIRSTEVLCVECYARAEEEQTKQAEQSKGSGQPKKQPQPQQQDWSDRSWPYTYRHHYYSTYHYSPFYSGSYYDSYYNDYDYRSFHHGSHGNFDEGDASAGGFYDS